VSSFDALYYETGTEVVWVKKGWLQESIEIEYFTFHVPDVPGVQVTGAK
jgi:hypothetical protein